MLQDQRLMADVLVEMSNGHFRKLASLSARTRGAVELGKVAAARFSPPTEDEYLQKMAASQLGEAYLEKLARAVINEEVSWDDLSDLEKTALGIGGIGRALKGVGQFFTKGKTVRMAGGPGSASGGIGARLRSAWNRGTGQQWKNLAGSKGGGPGISGPRTQTFKGGTRPAGAGAGPYRGAAAQGPATAVRPPPQQAGAQMRQRFQQLNQGAQPLQGNRAVQRASAAAGGTPGARKPLLSWRTKAGLGAAAVGAGGLYLGGKALDTANTFLHQQQPGAYQYGMGAPTPFMQPQGM